MLINSHIADKDKSVADRHIRSFLKIFSVPGSFKKPESKLLSLKASLLLKRSRCRNLFVKLKVPACYIHCDSVGIFSCGICLKRIIKIHVGACRFLIFSDAKAGKLLIIHFHYINELHRNVFHSASRKYFADLRCFIIHKFVFCHHW